MASEPSFWSYDEATDTLEISGIRYASDLFRAIGIGPIGSVFKIVSRADGVVTLERLPSPKGTSDHD